MGRASFVTLEVPRINQSINQSYTALSPMLEVAGS